MVAFPTPIIFFLTIPTNATTGARIVLDGINGFVLVYDATNVLIASMSGKDGTDNLGNTVFKGVVDYDSTNKLIATQLDRGEIRFLYLNFSQSSYIPGAMGPNNPGTIDHTIGGQLQIGSPSMNADHRSLLTLFGTSVDGTALPHVTLVSTDATDMVCAIEGRWIVFGEAWNPIPYNANWTDLGAPWRAGAFRRTDQGTVRFVGAIQWTNGVTAPPVAIFTLPVGYRPDGMLHLTTHTMPGAAVTPQVETIEITTTGVVSITNYPAGGPNTPITIEGLEFSIASTGQ